MSIPLRRFNQVILTVISGLLIAGASLLVALGPPPNRRTVEPPPPILEEQPISQTAPQAPESDAAADALTPVNLQTVGLNDAENQRNVSSTAHAATGRETKNIRSAPSIHKSPGSLPTGLVTIRRVPLSDSDAEAAWNQAVSNSCELLAPNEPFEITQPTRFLTDNDRRQAAGRDSNPGTRQHVLSVGLDMSRQVEQSLPMLGRYAITDYIRSHYVTIQARVQRDPVSGLAYLHHRPLAATMRFKGQRLTQEFTETVIRSVHDFHSLGLWLHPDEELKAENLRTLVLSHRYTTGQTGTLNTKTGSACELMFIRARFRDKNPTPGKRDRLNSSRGVADKGAGDLVLHTFVTTEGRQLLHYIAADSALHGSQSCGIKVFVKFTAFAHGAYPTESVVVGSEVRSSSTYRQENLTRFAQQKGWSGTGFDNLSKILDAIINQELTEE